MYDERTTVHFYAFQVNFEELHSYTVLGYLCNIYLFVAIKKQDLRLWLFAI